MNVLAPPWSHRENHSLPPDAVGRNSATPSLSAVGASAQEAPDGAETTMSSKALERAHGTRALETMREGRTSVTL